MESHPPPPGARAVCLLFAANRKTAAWDHSLVAAAKNREAMPEGDGNPTGTASLPFAGAAAPTIRGEWVGGR